jgi:hypothetical protein
MLPLFCSECSLGSFAGLWVLGFEMTRRLGLIGLVCTYVSFPGAYLLVPPDRDVIFFSRWTATLRVTLDGHVYYLSLSTRQALEAEEKSLLVEVSRQDSNLQTRD